MAAPAKPSLFACAQGCSIKPAALLTSRNLPARVTRSGQLAEVLNLVPWGGVSLQFRHLRLFGMQGMGGLGEKPRLLLHAAGSCNTSLAWGCSASACFCQSAVL